MDETITKASDTTIRVTKVIPEQVVEQDFSIEEMEKEISRLNEDIRMEEQMIANDEENYQRQISQARGRLDTKKAELVTWEARKVEAEKILPKDGVCDGQNSCEVGNLINIKETETGSSWNCEGINGGLTASCEFSKPIEEPVEEPVLEELLP